jgi:hypothetical protein
MQDLTFLALLSWLWRTLLALAVFAVMEKGPLSELCLYISYDSIYELAKENRLEYMTDSILDEYSEFAEE